ncbi:LptF/LptG family permease [Thermopirellula anaerolimosa]
MNIFTRYVLSELLRIFGLALVALTFLLAIGLGAREGLNRGMPPALIVRMMPFMLPEILGITTPIAVLLAISQVLGRISGTNELIAIRSAGLSPMVVVRPAIVFAYFISLFTVWSYDLAATWGRTNVRRVAVEALEEIVYAKLRREKGYESDKFVIKVMGLDGKRLIRPTITIQTDPNQPPVVLRAEQAELFTNVKAGILTIVCRKPVAEIGDARMTDSETLTQTIPLETPQPSLHRQWLSMAEIPAAVDQLRREVEQLRLYLQSAGAEKEQRAAWQAQIQQLQTRIRQLQTEPYLRWANGFSCLCFVLLGSPVSMYRRSENLLTNFFLCFLPILIIYYPMLMAAKELTTSGALPPIGYWAANLSIAVPGVFLLYRYCES